jgi:hypothetical protein
MRCGLWPRRRGVATGQRLAAIRQVPPRGAATGSQAAKLRLVVRGRQINLWDTSAYKFKLLAGDGSSSRKESCI